MGNTNSFSYNMDESDPFADIAPPLVNEPIDENSNKRAQQRSQVPWQVQQFRTQADILSDRAKQDRLKMIAAVKNANQQCDDLKRQASAIGSNIKKNRRQAKSLRRKASKLLKRSRSKCLNVASPSKENCKAAKCSFRKQQTKNGVVPRCVRKSRGRKSRGRKSRGRKSRRKPAHCSGRKKRSCKSSKRCAYRRSRKSGNRRCVRKSRRRTSKTSRRSRR